MNDGRVRRLVKRVARGWYDLNLRLSRWWLARRGEPIYELRGFCCGCGACCEHPSIALPRFLFHLRLLRRLIIAWQEHVNGWEFERLERPSRALVFRCLHYDPETRRCRNYDTRPGCCRDYPRLHLYEGSPNFFESCTHYAYRRDAEEVRAQLDELSLPADKYENIRKRFYVWEPPEKKDPEPRRPAA